MSKKLLNFEDDFEKINPDEYIGEEGDKHTIETDNEEEKETIINIKDNNTDKKNTINIQEGEIDYFYEGLKIIGKDLKESIIDVKNEIKNGFNSLLMYLSTLETNIKEPEELEDV